MTIQETSIDKLIQYSILVAGEQDEFFDRQLGPIHLIKYVYLADIAYSRRNAGATHTNAPWKFYHFGPWATEVNDRINPSLTSINANRKDIPSNYDDNFTRWSLSDEYLLEKIEREIPVEITSYLKWCINTFKQDTPSLLDYVYKTEPMLNAAPNEFLNFKIVVSQQSVSSAEKPQLRMDSLSNRKKKLFKERMHELRKERANKKHQIRELVNPIAESTIDEIYWDGLRWLDELAGQPFEEKNIKVKFSPDVWHSTNRKGGDVS